MGQMSIVKARETQRQYEELADFIWALVAQNVIKLADVPVYLFVLKSWRSRHWNPAWNPQAATAVVDELRIATSILTGYFDLSRYALKGLLQRLSAAPTPGGAPLLWHEYGEGSGCQTLFRLLSPQEPNQLLVKHGPLANAYPVFDKVHQGMFLPWGNLWRGEVTRYFEASPICTLEAAGAYLWLLHEANIQAVKTGQQQRGLGVVRERVAFGRRDTRQRVGGLALERPLGQEALALIERLGWVRKVVDPTRKRPPPIHYDVTEAPATIIEFIALAHAAQRELPMHMADVWINEVLEGTRGIVWACNSARDLGWPLTAAGYDLACLEINRLRMLTDTFTTAAQVPDYILDTINDFPEETDRAWLHGNVQQLIHRKGLVRVWNVLYAAHQKLERQPGAIENVIGWIQAAVKADPVQWPLPSAPKPVDYSKYTEGQLAYLFEEPCDK